MVLFIFIIADVFLSKCRLDSVKYFTSSKDQKMLQIVFEADDIHAAVRRYWLQLNV